MGVSSAKAPPDRRRSGNPERTPGTVNPSGLQQDRTKGEDKVIEMTEQRSLTGAANESGQGRLTESWRTRAMKMMAERNQGEATMKNATIEKLNDGEMTPRDIEAAAYVLRAQRGDREAFTRLIELYRERILRLAQQMVGNPEDAQDLCQETFVRVYRALHSFDRKRPFTPWVYRIAYNVIYDYLRRKKVRPAIADLDEEWPLEERVDDGGATPEQALMLSETQKQVQAAIQALPENYRDVVVFRFVDNLSYAEIAETLGLTDANVMMRMSRARRMLRDKLQHLHAGAL